MYPLPHTFGAYAHLSGGFHGGSSSSSWICLAAAVVLAIALVMPAGVLLGGGGASAVRVPSPSVAKSSLAFAGPAAWGHREGFATVTSKFPNGDRVARQVPLESLALVHAKTGDYSVANTLLQESKRRRAANATSARAPGVSGPSGVDPRNDVASPFDALDPAASPLVVSPAADGNPTGQPGTGLGNQAINPVTNTPYNPARIPATNPAPNPAPNSVPAIALSVPVTEVKTLRFDGVRLNTAWLSSSARKDTGEGWTGSANGGRQVSLLDAFLGPDKTVSAGGISRKVYRMQFGFQGIALVTTYMGTGYAYIPGKLALVAHLADKPVGSNGETSDLVRIRYFGSIDEKGKPDYRAYADFKPDSPPDTWAFRRVDLATGAQSFCMFDAPQCPPLGKRNADTKPFFVLYTSKNGGPEGVALSSDLDVASDTCSPAMVLERHLRDMAWWSFE